MFFDLASRIAGREGRMKSGDKLRQIENLNNRLRLCKECRLSSTRNNVLLGEGNVDSRLMIIALAPGRMEDLTNHMFVGPSGRILDRLFDSVGIDRQSIYMTNLIECTLPKNRRPGMDEIESCSQFLDKEMAIIDPEVLAPLGFYATRYILNKYHEDSPQARADFARLCGKLFVSETQTILPLPHPASLIYNPSFQPETVEKYKRLRTLV
jgi:DNA polymerase